MPLTQNPWRVGVTPALPWLTLASLYAGIYARVLRGELINNMNEDYIRTARAKGLSERRILLRHALRCSLITIVSLFGLDFGALVGGAASLTEVVFGLRAWVLTYQSLQDLDLPLIMGCVMYGAFFVVLASAVVDIALRLHRSEGARCRFTDPADAVLSVRDLSVSFATRQGVVRAVDGSPSTSERKEVVGHRRRIGLGQERRDVLDARARARRQRLDHRAASISRARDPRPLRHRDAIGARRRGRHDLPGPDDRAHARLHRGLADRRATARPQRHDQESRPRSGPIELLAEVGIPGPRQPCQPLPPRVLRRHAPARRHRHGTVVQSKLLIADEPTTALDVTTQAQILDLMGRLQETHGSSIVIITHDMGVIAEIADRVVVMYAGRPAEIGPELDVVRSPRHPYTWGLLGAVPRADVKTRRLVTIPGNAVSPLEVPGVRLRAAMPIRMDVCESAHRYDGDHDTSTRAG